MEKQIMTPEKKAQRCAELQALINGYKSEQLELEEDLRLLAMNTADKELPLGPYWIKYSNNEKKEFNRDSAIETLKQLGVDTAKFFSKKFGSAFTCSWRAK
jgi:hypothetical protein